MSRPNSPSEFRLEALRACLEAMARRLDPEAVKRLDPIGVVHRYEDPNDREVMALIASAVAFGRVQSIRRSLEKIADALGPWPAQFIEMSDEKELLERFHPIVHRIYRGADLARLLLAARDLRRIHGSLAQAIERFAQTPLGEAWALSHPLASRPRLLALLVRLGDALRAHLPASRPSLHLVPSVRHGSTCKRLLLFLRWMCRPADGIDLGLARFPLSELVIPMDTHVHRFARALGLTSSKSPSMRAAVEVSDALRLIDEKDPVRFDAVLCHLGFTQPCPLAPRHDPCQRCPLRRACAVWMGHEKS
ncbi:MAG: TIGR02757 family protein [Sandaracinaceae bacterium]|nr:TIGR02757 family protein [Sandaracinaceae bacterium]MDW8245445.1 TIGR02757 family protein [Sandaracinaceae bacterium]